MIVAYKTRLQGEHQREDGPVLEAIASVMVKGEKHHTQLEEQVEQLQKRLQALEAKG